MRRVLITGGSGFLGTNLVEHYRRDGSAQVLNYDVRRPRCAPQVAHWVDGDVLDFQRLLSVMKSFQPTHLVHLAARTDLAGPSMADYRSNTEGVRVVLACLRRYGTLHRAVFASTRLVCALGEVPTCDYDYFPPNHYGRSKVVGEQLVRGFDAETEWVIVRPTSIWGPWGEAPYRDFFLSLARGTYLHPGRERIQKHYGYVGNTVYQVSRMLTSPAERVVGRTFYLADPEPTEIAAFAAGIRRALGLPAPRSVPVPVLRAVAGVADAVNATRVASLPFSTDRLRNLRTPMLYELDEVADLVGPLPFTLEQGIAATVAHLREAGDLPAAEGVSRRIPWRAR